MSIHSVHKHQDHLAWDNSIPPVLTISSGSEVSFDCTDASNGQILPDSTQQHIQAFDFARLDQVNGPVFVEDAEPGDVLQVDVLEVRTAEWGWTGLIPGFGLLADEYTEHELKIWKIQREEGYAWFDEEKGIKIPIRPFAGEMGVAPAEKGAFSTIPPYKTGGNMDTKHFTVGSRVFFPIGVKGALFSMGDGHAAQGEGEVCGTAIETPITAKVRLTVLKDKKKSEYVETPHFVTTMPPTSQSTGEEYYCTTGVGNDIRTCTRDAVRSMIKFLMAEKGLNRVEAYMLCSVAGDLKLHEVVDMPNYVVGMMLPQSIFTK